MTLRRGLIWFVLFALVAAQALGLMHRVAHGGHIESVPGVVALHADADGDADSGHGWLAQLFAGHDDESGCRIYDQLGQSGFLTAPAAVPLPLLLPSFYLQWFQGEVLARCAALFDARGPPLVR